jgi:hypothetical protein
MSAFEFQHTKYTPDQLAELKETLRVSRQGITGFLKTFTGLQGDSYVSLVPALHVSGYGDSESEALEALKENLNTLFDDLFGLPEVERHREIINMGWSKDSLFKKRFTSSYVDKDGVLQNFDYPEQVKISALQAA